MNLKVVMASEREQLSIGTLEYKLTTCVNRFEGSTATAALFFTAPASYMTNVACFFSGKRLLLVLFFL